jgi:hypothetical protein
MGVLYVIKMPKGTYLRRVTEQELAESKVSYRYPYTKDVDVHNDDGDYVGYQSKTFYFEDVLEIAIKNASAPWLVDFTKDTWIVYADGTPAAQVKFDTSIVRLQGEY